MSDNRSCTCHPDEAPKPCQKRYAFSECQAADRIEQLEAALRGIKWRSADRDNMEFAATITYSQMDAIRAALEERT